MSINNNITIGAYTFTVNPNKYSVTPNKLKSSKRSLNGTLNTTYITDAFGNAVIKRNITIGGISEDQLNSIFGEFQKAEDIVLIDIFGESITVQFDNCDYDINADDPNHPNYNLSLTEV